jgi:hypothetical protein
VSWFLAQDAWTVPGGNHENIAKLEQSQLPDSERVLQNNTRWGALKAWSNFLGFGITGTRPTRGTLLADPTLALQKTLPQIFKEDVELDQERFLQRIAKALPVLDRGTYRMEVEARINKAVWQPLRSDQVSTSLSRALIRLDTAKLLRLDDRSDADKCTLTGRNGTALKSVSHFVYAGGKRVS